MDNKLNVSVVSQSQIANTDIEKTIYDLNEQIEGLSNHADRMDYFLAIGSGLLCGLLDVFWVGEFDLNRGKSIADKQVEETVKKIAGKMGCKSKDIKGAVKFLEDKFPIPSDGNMSDFGGGLQHHLRDFSHHPTIVGLIFSLLTQFTGKSYGTDTEGSFLVVKVPDNKMNLIGESIYEKLFRGVVIWFFHLISDVAGSSSTAGLGGGTGIPGPVLSLAKELSALPFIKKFCIGEIPLSRFLSKMFNGTLFAKHDENGNIIKGTEIRFDFRGELGSVKELEREAIPVIINDSIVRVFYFFKRFCSALRGDKIKTLKGLKDISWDDILPFNNPTITRMLLISSGVFTTIDCVEAIVTEKNFVSVNFIGVGRFTVAIGSETVNYLKVRNIKKIKKMYERIQKNTYSKNNEGIFKDISEEMALDKFSLTVEQAEILYNIELQKTLNDVNNTKVLIKEDKIQKLKNEWIEEWKHFMEIGFPGFIQNENAELKWFDKDELLEKIKENNPHKTWYRLVLLEAMIFEPYYPLSVEKNKKGKEIPSKKYNLLNSKINGFNSKEGDHFLDENYLLNVIENNYITNRLRKTYTKVNQELNEIIKSVLKSVSITAVSIVTVAITAWVWAPTIAVALVGAKFTELSGAALTSACLAYLGGGAIASGGFGMAGGTMVITGGGAVLGLGVGGTGTSINSIRTVKKENIILQSAKLMVSIKEIFIKDNQDISYSELVHEKIESIITGLELNKKDLKNQINTSKGEERKKIRLEIKNYEDSLNILKIASKSIEKSLKSNAK